VKQLVLCIDRDNDIGKKTGIEGPVFGRELNLEAAKRLGLKDPQDTDLNAIYGAIKTADEVGADIVTLTGNEHVGIVSDREIGRQLEEVIGKLNPDSVIFVSDGMDDEQVLPIIQSRIKVDAVVQVVVRQSRELEKAYFKLTNFMKEVTEDPMLARLIFGLPGFIILLLAIWGFQALSIIMAFTGLYLIIKGLGLEEEVFDRSTQFIKSLSIERISTGLYIIAAITLVVGFSIAYQDMQRISLSFADSSTTFNTVALYMLNSNSINIIILACIIAIAARIIDEWSFRRVIQIRRYMIVAAFIVFVAIVVEGGANYIINEEYDFLSFVLNGIVGVFSLAIWTKMTEYFFLQELSTINSIIKRTQGKPVFSQDGGEIGVVKRCVVDNLELSEIIAGGRTYSKNQILEVTHDRITVKEGK
jgi:putative membrane protein